MRFFSFMNISPFSLTSGEFQSLLSKACGRGEQQAGDLYSCFMREGSFRNTLSSFKNAPKLYQEMVSIVDTRLLQYEIVGEDSSSLRFCLLTDDGCRIESVLMRMQHGLTLCVSSQIGCRMGCRFCCTGLGGFVRNLSPREIVQQLFIARHVLKWDVKNIVFMGMGEPFDTKEAVFRAVDIFTDPLGLGIGMRHVTISTSGDIQGIISLASRCQPTPHLAISLNAVSDGERAALMPYRKYDTLHELREAILLYCRKKRRQVLISYALLKGVNDSLGCMDTLSLLLENIPAKINLIPFNTYPGALYEEPDEDVVEACMKRLREKGFRVLLRGRKGDSLGAACGQLQKTSSLC